jgi:hypothetical protein
MIEYMTFDQLVNIIQLMTPLFLVKLLAVTVLFLHLFLSLLLVRQTKIMIQVVEAQIAPTLYLVVIIHLVFSLFVLLWTVIFL